MICPICGTELRTAERQGMRIDFCPICRGVWLDRGELDRIVERSGSQSPRQDHMERREDGWD